ncbi:MAG: winged helix-turn-helix transcriptional regulator [Candidatus Odinarchaeota archaeon]
MLNTLPDEELLKKVIDDFTSIIESWLKDAGAGPYAGRILMTILLSDKPLTQKDIAERLNTSLSTISRSMRLITDNPPLITRSRVPNSKEWQYEKRANTPLVLLSGMILSFAALLRNNIFPMESALIQMKNISEELKERPETQRFQSLLENVLSASKVMIEELERLLAGFQTQLTEE